MIPVNVEDLVVGERVKIVYTTGACAELLCTFKGEDRWGYLFSTQKILACNGPSEADWYRKSTLVAARHLAGRTIYRLLPPDDVWSDPWF